MPLHRLSHHPPNSCTCLTVKNSSSCPLLLVEVLLHCTIPALGDYSSTVGFPPPLLQVTFNLRNPFKEFCNILGSYSQCLWDWFKHRWFIKSHFYFATTFPGTWAFWSIRGPQTNFVVVVAWGGLFSLSLTTKAFHHTPKLPVQLQCVVWWLFFLSPAIHRPPPVPDDRRSRQAAKWGIDHRLEFYSFQLFKLWSSTPGAYKC